MFHARNFLIVAGQALLYMMAPVPLALLFVVFLVVQRGEPLAESTSDFVFAIATTLTTTILAWITYARFGIGRGIFSPPDIKRILLLLPASLLVRIFLVLPYLVVLFLYQGDFDTFVQEGINLQQSGMDFSSPSGVRMAFFVSVVMAPIHEELFFRGIIGGFLQKHYKPFVSIICTNVLFAIFHGHPILMLGAFFMGISMSVVLYRWGSLWYSIFLHAFLNMLPFGLMLMSPEG